MTDVLLFLLFRQNFRNGCRNNKTLRNWRYYLQGLPYSSLVDLLKDAARMGLNVRPLHRLKKKRKWYIRKEIEDAFISSEQFQNRVQVFYNETRI